MKQAELNKSLSAELRKSAKAHNWNYSRGFVFKATELLFFSIITLGQVKRRHLSYRLRYKLLAFDDLFWKIVKMKENLRQPLSFRASGAWTAPMATVSEGELSIADWDPTNLHSQVNDIIDRCNVDAAKVSSEIRGLDDNLGMIERLYARLKTQHPDAVTNIWPERLLTSILKNEYDCSETIIRDRLNNHDSGGFPVGAKSFYDLANEYLHAIRNMDV
jgi:hypothetical protein